LLGADPRSFATSAKRTKHEPSAATREIPPSGLHGSNAMPSCAHSSGSGSLERYSREYWSCTLASRPPRMAWSSAWLWCRSRSPGRPTGSASSDWPTRRPCGRSPA
jgi:hypothetical protein